MAITYRLLASTVLTASQQTITFSSIPQTFTDLQLRLSLRMDNATYNATNVDVTLNGGITGTSYSYTYRYSRLATANNSSSANTSSTQILGTATNYYLTGAFSNAELNVFDYASTLSNKTISSINAFTSTTYTQLDAGQLGVGVLANTAAVTSIQITPTYATNWIAGSTFYLYGILKA